MYSNMEDTNTSDKTEEIKIEPIFYRLHFWTFIFLKIEKTAPNGLKTYHPGGPLETSQQATSWRPLV
jgi:hypothetical protein